MKKSITHFSALLALMMLMQVFTSNAGSQKSGSKLRGPGEGVLSLPEISVTPALIEAAVYACGDSVTVPMVVHNVGSSSLNFTIASGANFFDDFESGMSKWVATGTWGITTDAYAGSGALCINPGSYYGNYWNSWVMMKDSLLVMDKDSCILSYWHKQSMESCCDRTYTQISVNGGAWTTVETWSAYSGWAYRILSLSSYVNNGDYFKIRFQFTSDVSVVDWGPYIDNLRVGGVGGLATYVSVDPLSGFVLPGDSAMCYVTFHGAGMNSGTYSSGVTINSNDPLHPQLIVPAVFHVYGTPQIHLSANTLDFGSIMEHTTTGQQFYVTNHGCDNLHVTGIVSSIPEYVPDPAVFTVIPGDSQLVTITFQPQAAGTYLADLTVLSDAGDVPLYVSGEATGAPIVAASPDSFEVVLPGCNDTLTYPLTVFNNGSSDMYVSFNLGSGTGGAGGGGLLPAGCTPGTYGYCCDMGIYNFTFNTIDNSSANGSVGYQDFTSITTLVVPGQTYPVSVQTGSDYNENVRIWIDFNNNGSFEADEKVFENLSGYINHDGFIAIPFGTVTNTPLRLRVASDYYNNSPPEPCNDVEYGQVEDYVVIVMGGTTISPAADTIPPGSSQDFTVQFSSSNLISGTFLFPILVFTNDPVTPTLTVPCEMTIIGAPVIEAGPMIVDFGTIQQFTATTAPITLYNRGCAILNIDSIVSSIPEVTCNANNFMILPLDSVELTLTFAPMASGLFDGTLTIFNDDVDVMVTLTGYSNGAPAIFFAPPVIEAIVPSCNDSVMVPLTLYNTGSGDLIYNIPQIGEFTDDFENGLDNWAWDGYWGLYAPSYNSSNALATSPWGYYNDYWDQTITMKDSVTVLNKDSCVLSYWFKSSMECCCDYVNVMISINGGPFNTFASWGCYSDWTYITHSLSTGVNNGDYIKIGFYFHSDYSVTGAGGYIDDLRIGGVGTMESWLTVSPDTGTILPGDSAVINVWLNSTGLIGGTYYSNVLVFSNDPLNPIVTVPVSITVNGNTSLTVQDTVMTFPPVMEYTTISDTLQVFNEGCNVIVVDSIVMSNADFSVPYTSFVFYPGEIHALPVYCRPTVVGEVSGTMTLYYSGMEMVITLFGEGTEAPFINVSPDSIAATIASCDDSTMVAVLLSNTGQADLHWSAISSDTLNDGLSFNGSNTYGYCGYWVPGTRWTLEAWVKPEVIQTGRRNLVGALNSCLDWAITLVDGYPCVTVRQPGGCSASYPASAQLIPGQWYHIVGVNDGNEARLYMNGILEASGPVESFYTGTNNYVALGYSPCCGEYFQGTLDEVRIWNIPRTQTEIQYWMFRQLSGTETGLAAYWTFNNMSGIYFNDFSGHGHGGTIYNGSVITSDAPVSRFIQLENFSGTLTPGQFENLNIKLYSKGLNSGVYTSSIKITSNDPLEPIVVVPVTLTVDGVPVTEVPDSCVDFGSTLQYTTLNKGFTLANMGCDTLVVTNIYSAGSVFTANPTAFRVPPGQSVEVTATFAPLDVGLFQDTLYVESNDDLKRVCVSGESTPIPVISIDPDSLYATLTCTLSDSIPFTISNLGASPLIFSLSYTNPFASSAVTAGTVPPGSSQTFMVHFDKSDSPIAVYYCEMHITCNDPLTPAVTVPITMEVPNIFIPVDLGNDTILCEAGTITLYPGHYASYTWNDGSPDSTLFVSTTGTYFVDVVDYYGCFTSDTVHILVTLNPVVDAGPDTTLCTGTSYTFPTTVLNQLPSTPVEIQVGNGTSFMSSTAQVPFGTYYMDHRTQLLYKKSELNASGLIAGMVEAIAFNVGSVGAPGMNGFNIRLGTTPASQLTNYLSGLTTVYSHSYYMPITGWNVFMLNTPFFWNGVDNLVVEICFDNGSWSSNSSMQYTSVPGTVYSSYCDNCAPGCNISSGSTYSERVNMKIWGEGNPTRYYWSGPGGFVSHEANPVLSNISYSNAGIYYVTVDDGAGCMGYDTVIVAVNPGPGINAGQDQAVVYGASVQLNATITGAIPPYTIHWTPVAGLSNPNIANPVATPLVTTTYTARVTSANLCTAADQVVITVLPVYQISGTVSYLNPPGTPLSETKVLLKNDATGARLDSVVTGTDGNYQFGHLINGSFNVTGSSQKTWGGVNATDALEVARHVVYLSTLTGLKLKAADVNNNGLITSADPLLILRRSVGLISSFAAGDWVFENNTVQVNNGNVLKDFKGLCTGDVNGSYVPGLKAAPTISVDYDQLSVVSPGEVLDLPVRVKGNLQLGAATLGFVFPGASLEIEGVSSILDGFVYSLAPGNLRFAWENTTPVLLNDNEVLMVLKIRLKSGTTNENIYLMLDPESEFADAEASVYDNTRLLVPHIGSIGSSRDVFLGDCMPNPFSNNTLIDYSLPESGNIILGVYDLTGKPLMELVNGSLDKGAHRYVFDGSRLAAGTYFYRLEFRGTGTRSSQTKLMVISR